LRGVTDFTIRPATAADASTLGRLGALLVRTHHDFDPSRFIPASRQTERGYGGFLRSQIEDPDVVVLVAEMDGQVIGYAYGSAEGTDYMSLRGPAGVLHDIIVDPDRRKLGAGRALLEATVAALRAKGVPRIVLQTAEKNAGAQHLFASAGFRTTMLEMTRDI
jgi:ribosomal protein S18 acetylase RimI-like enzyme